MSTTKPAISHLTQESLSCNDQKILAGIVDWTCRANFEKKKVDNFELCVNDGLSEIWTSLKGMDLVQKVWQGLLILGLPAYTYVSFQSVDGRSYEFQVPSPRRSSAQREVLSSAR